MRYGSHRFWPCIATAVAVIVIAVPAASAAVVKYDTQVGMYPWRGGLYDGYVKSTVTKCMEGRRVVLYKQRSGADRKLATARSAFVSSEGEGWWEVDLARAQLPRRGGLAYARVMPKVGDGFVCRADRSEIRGLSVPPRHH